MKFYTFGDKYREMADIHILINKEHTIKVSL